MAKTIVQRILAETRARLRQREDLERIGTGSSPMEPALLDDLMRRFASEVAPVLGQLVAREVDRAFRAVPSPRGSVSPFGPDFMTARSSDSDTIRNIADLFDPNEPDGDADEEDDGPSDESGESDLGFPLDELKKQLESIMADTDLGQSRPESDSTELGDTLASAARQQGSGDDETDALAALPRGEAAPTQQIASSEIDRARRESKNLSYLREPPGEETQQISTALDELFRDPRDEERFRAGVGLRDTARPEPLEEASDPDADGPAERDGDGPLFQREGLEDDDETREDPEELQELDSSELRSQLDILEEIGTSLDQKVAEYWEENGQRLLADEVALELEEDAIAPEAEDAADGDSVADGSEDDTDKFTDNAVGLAQEAAPFVPLDEDEDEDLVETRALNLRGFSSEIREGRELERIQRQLRGLVESGPPISTEALEAADARELVSVVRILQNSQSRLLATIERLADLLSSRVEKLIDRVSQRVTGS